MKENNTSIKKNFVMNIILTVSSVAFPMISFPYVSRVLSPSGTGKVSFAASFVFYFTTLAQLGIPTYGIRTCAQVRDDREKLSKTVHELLFIQFIMSIISYCAFFIAIFNVPKLEADRLLYLIVGIKIFFEAMGMEWLYKALEQYSYITKRSVIFKFIALILMFVFVKTPGDYRIYAGLLIFADTASNLLNIFNVGKFINLKWIGNYNLKKHLKAVIIFFAMVCATTIYTHLDTVMLGFMKSDVDVGYYNVAVKIKTVLVSLVTSLGAVLLPRTSYYVENNLMEEFRKLSCKAMHFVIILSVPLMLYFTFFAEEGIRFIAGREYGGAVVPMQVLMPTLVVIGITNILGIQVLVPLGKEKVVLHSQIAGAITDVILNYLLIPKYAATGASIGTLFAEVAVLTVQCIALRDVLASFFNKIKYYKMFVALVPATLTAFAFATKIKHCFIVLVVTSIVFFGVYGICMILMKENLATEIFGDMMKKITQRKYKK